MHAKRPIYEIQRPDFLEIVTRTERRKALSLAEKVRTWFRQMFRYALIIVPGLPQNPAFNLDVVAPPVRHNPFLRLDELPAEHTTALDACHLALFSRQITSATSGRHSSTLMQVDCLTACRQLIYCSQGLIAGIIMIMLIYHMVLVG